MNGANRETTRTVQEHLRPTTYIYGHVSFLPVTVVIPTLNEELGIAEVLRQIFTVLKGYPFRILVVDGHSTDDTVNIARDTGAMVIFQRNKGYGGALSTGFLYAREHFERGVIIMMDADLTYDPKDIPRLVEPILEDQADLVIGNRFSGLQAGAMPLLNRLGNRLISWLARLVLGIGVYDTQCGIRAFRTELVEQLHLESEGMPFAIEMLTEAKFAGARIMEIPVTYRPRAGDTKLHPIRDGLKITATILRLSHNDGGQSRKRPLCR